MTIKAQAAASTLCGQIKHFYAPKGDFDLCRCGEPAEHPIHLEAWDRIGRDQAIEESAKLGRENAAA